MGVIFDKITDLSLFFFQIDRLYMLGTIGAQHNIECISMLIAYILLKL